jgi:murein L,D-transpeptidase YafK
MGGILFFMIQQSNGEDRLPPIRARVLPDLTKKLTPLGLKPGLPIYVRIFKETNELEVWMEPKPGAEWRLAAHHPIATWGSGTLGPKLAEGDRQAPEGFYSVGRKQLNPKSSYHLSFNIGYPNEYDQAHKRTGSLIMVHGSNVSIGCFAMTDPLIEEIYLLAEAAFDGGQKTFRVHIFPFRMSAKRMETAEKTKSQWLDFWRELQPFHDRFENTKKPPEVEVKDKAYKLP